MDSTICDLTYSCALSTDSPYQVWVHEYGYIAYITMQVTKGQTNITNLPENL